MYMIVVYDIDVKRISSIHNYLRQNLHWVQNSVFEGEVRLSQLMRIKEELREFIKSGDSVIIYTFKSKKHLKRWIIGTEKNKIQNIF
ncbi:CRISPR-associated endonuclease Cas2 [candidate division Kazan bacterium]|uniref:CRISPR-associated endoribonuclease Cas2 n=1 Tax=candidate division Kazan bacterium TaxID=2202143 RepID=A0A420ZCX4_UNCK3|nr:MAG: CRISPR-associated endonuclease Cas2 [candidate division Kazan bacterium]